MQPRITPGGDGGGGRGEHDSVKSHNTCTYICMLMRDEERSKQGQTNNKAKLHSTPKVVTFPKKNELPQVGLEHTTLYTLDRALYQLSFRLGPNLTSHSAPDEQAYQGFGSHQGFAGPL